MGNSMNLQCRADARISMLEKKARIIRILIINICYEAGTERKAHPGPALSSTDIVTALFFDIMRLDPTKQKWPDRDRFILSKGHASPLLYAVLVEKGFISREQIKSFRRVNGMLQGHPDMKGVPGVDMTSGSLGNGLSAGMGMALAARIEKKDYHVFVVLGDGECQEGLVWEAAMSASKYALDNLIAIVDCNGYQSCDSVKCTMPVEPFSEKWLAFGWNVMEIDGHDMVEIISSLELAVRHKGKPTVILANTVKGKGVSFMENDNTWHQRALSDEHYRIAMAELGGAMQNVIQI